jgi:hypothetical protein
VALRGVTLCTALAVAVASCAGGDDPAGPATTDTAERTSTTTTAPERPASTTTTAFDPASVEGAVEAAYLRSWDVYADAVYDLELDEPALASVYAGEHLETKRNEIEGRIEDGRAAHVRIDHDYTIDLVDDSTAIVIDRYRNHQVLIDPATKQPIEDDPDELVVDAVTLRLVSGLWHVALKERLGR